jgi:hypothetical protein
MNFEDFFSDLFNAFQEFMEQIYPPPSNYKKEEEDVKQ